MPNILITNNAQFKPFSYEELVRPIEYATAQQNAYEDAYNTLGDAADMIASNLDPNDPDSQKALNIYNTYNAKLGQARDALMQNSFMDPNTKRSLLDLKKLYANGMQKVGAAVANRQKDLELAKQLRLKDPNIVTTPIGGVDSYMEGKNLPLSAVNLDDKYKKAAVEAAAISNRLLNDPELSNFKGKFYDIIQRKGYSPEAVNEILSEIQSVTPEGSSKYPEFKRLFEGLMNDATVENLSDADQTSVKNAIMRGITDGIVYDVKHSFHQIPVYTGGGGGGSSSTNNSGNGLHSLTNMPVTTQNVGMVNESANDLANAVKNSEKYWKNNQKGVISVHVPGVSGYGTAINVPFVYQGEKYKGKLKTRKDFVNYGLEIFKKNHAGIPNKTTMQYATEALNDAYSKNYKAWNEMGLKELDMWNEGNVKQHIDAMRESGSGIQTSAFDTYYNGNDFAEAVASSIPTKDGKITINVLNGASKNGLSLKTKTIPATALDNITRVQFNPSSMYDKNNPERQYLLVHTKDYGKIFVPATAVNEQLNSHLNNMRMSFEQIRKALNTTLSDEKILQCAEYIYGQSSTLPAEIKKMSEKQKADLQELIIEMGLRDAIKTTHDLLPKVATRTFSNTTPLE